MANNGINPELLPAVPSTSSSSPLDTLRPTLLNQTVGTSRNQPILNHEEYIPSPSQHNIPAVNQDIFNHGHNQEIPDLALDQHVSSLTLTVTSPATVDPFRSQDDPLLISCLEYNIPALVTALDQNILSLASTSNQNNINLHVVEKQSQGLNPCLNVPSVTPTLDQDNPHPGQDISSILQDHTPSLDLDLDAILHILNSDVVSQPKTSENKDTENARMLKIANNAMEELMKLLSMNEPFWFRSLVDERFVLQRDCYQRIFQRSNSLNGPHARVESSKDSRVVKMSGTELVEMFLNSDKWADLFPTIVKKAETIEVLESGSLGNRNGALQLMNAEMHILSPLVPTREFSFLRYCKQIEAGVWTIGDVSIDSSTHEISNVSSSRRLPSGLLIQEIADGLCRVSKSPDSRRNILRLTRRMVKSFCESLCMQDNTSFPHLTRMNNGAIRVAIRWDVLCSGNAGHEIQRITTGSNPGNCVSIMRSLNYVMNGEDTSLFPILPSGFTISRDAKPDVPEGQSGEVGKSEGSLVTLMFQILASSPSRMSMVDIEFVSNVNALVTSTIEHIKDALNCSHSK
ncbi:Homeobox-leucine zipper protein [Vigna angularis]|uniref:Homeobox-leucine zipper protein n=1 Tax=Phaseolus angularis TaxID=3914 RepID=A0A8T0LCM0_PHAAN|nr:Homeobox-leucine zipper protein [Vigna angularis]